MNVKHNVIKNCISVPLTLSASAAINKITKPISDTLEGPKKVLFQVGVYGIGLGVGYSIDKAVTDTYNESIELLQNIKEANK